MESSIRDSLAANLHLIDSNLTLISKEYYLPNPEGTKSFVDILAKDDVQNYVVIEIKKTNQAARQAIHEVIKYVEALKKNKKCTNGEIIVLVAAVEWKELIGPFSSFVRISDFTIKGIMLTVDEEYSVVSCTEVSPLNEFTSRCISPIQICRLFANRKDLDRGLISHKSCFDKTGMKDYVVLILKAGNTMIPYEHAMYTAIQRQSKEDYICLLHQDEATLDEVLSYIESNGFSEEEEINILESNLIGGLGEYPECDDIETGCPRKLANMLGGEGWIIEKLIRYGAFKENHLLSDDQIVDEIKGLRGVGNSVYRNKISSKYIERLDEVKREVSKTLTHNIAWNHQICTILDYYKESASRGDFEIKIEIYSPNDIILDLYTNYSEIVQPNGLPRFLIEVNFPDDNDMKKVYSGMIRWNGNRPDIDSIIRRHYNNDPSLVSWQSCTGAAKQKNNHISEDMGCEYISLLRIFEAKKPKGVYLMNKYEFDRVDNSSLNYLYIHDIPRKFPCVIEKIRALFDNLVFVNFGDKDD